MLKKTKSPSFRILTALLVVITLLLLLNSFVFAGELGDVNGSGVVSVEDVVMVMRHVLEIEMLDENQILVADVNQDGDINILDVTLMVQFVLDIIDEFPDTADKVNLVLNVYPENSGTALGGGAYEKGAVVEILASAVEGWEFFAWTGRDAANVLEAQEVETTITMDSNKEVTAFFADVTEERHEIRLETRAFMGAQGKARDITNHPPYPPGFKVELQAVPEDPNIHIFTHWGLQEGNPGGPLEASKYFENIEDPNTFFTVPDRLVTVLAYFTTWEDWNEPRVFDYTHDDFGRVKSGRVGVHFDFWDISEVEEGRAINFYFQASIAPN